MCVCPEAIRVQPSWLLLTDPIVFTELKDICSDTSMDNDGLQDIYLGLQSL